MPLGRDLDRILVQLAALVRRRAVVGQTQRRRHLARAGLDADGLFVEAGIRGQRRRRGKAWAGLAGVGLSRGGLDEVAPAVRVLGGAAVGDVTVQASRLDPIHDAAVRRGQHHALLVPGRHREAGVQFSLYRVLAGREDQQDLTRLERPCGQHPTQRVPRVIRQAPALEVHGRGVQVGDLEPVRGLLVLVGDALNVGRDQLVDDHLWVDPTVAGAAHVLGGAGVEQLRRRAARVVRQDRSGRRRIASDQDAKSKEGTHGAQCSTLWTSS